MRCAWCLHDPLYIEYHDQEWGIPVKSAEKLFEMLVLESMQAGLSWITVLRKREAMAKAFFHFSPERLAKLSDSDLELYLQNPALIRNQLKIKSVRHNARRFLAVTQRENIVDYFWQFTGEKTIHNSWQEMQEVPAITAASVAMAKQLKKDGFSFMGPTSCYAFMQAVGMVNDHLQCCFRWRELVENSS